MRLNRDRLAEVDKRVRDEIHGLEREIWTLAGEEFVIGSPQQLGAVLFEKLGLSRKRRGKTGFSTDARVLQAIRDEHEIIPKIERWRELNQILKTYLDVLPQLTDTESRVHTTFVQAAATTGRLASTNPNMQNVPVRTELGREIRGCFEAAPGNVLISADYSQVELRVLANIAGEEVLKEIFVRGEDVHTATGSVVFGKDPSELTPMDRSKSKMINYGIVYGLSDYGLADRLNIPREEAKAFIDAYLERFPRVAEFIRTTIESAREQGHVTTLFGRRRQIPELRARNWQVRSLGERLAVNTVIQGTAADIMKLAMIRVHRALAESAHEDADDPHHPRRAALRGPARGGRRRQGARRARDDRAVGRPHAAARGRRRRGPDLARGEVARRAQDRRKVPTSASSSSAVLASSLADAVISCVAAVVCCVEAETWSVDDRGALGHLGDGHDVAADAVAAVGHLVDGRGDLGHALGHLVDGDVDALEGRAGGLDRGDALLADLVAGGDGLDGAPRLGLDLARPGRRRRRWRGRTPRRACAPRRRRPRSRARARPRGPPRWRR